MAVHVVPQEIWWLVCQDLQKQQDFNGLYNSAQVSKSWATLALPLLYSLHDWAGSDDVGTTVRGKAKWAGMWRSIILSATGVTLYPYCLWLKSLSLGDLEQLLQLVATDQNLRPRFFEGPMRQFEIVAGTATTTRSKALHFNVLEWQRIVETVGNVITKYAKDAADEEDKTVQLMSLEGFNMPTNLLKVWVSRLSTLTTLTIRDGSVLTEEVGAALRDNCPLFKDLTCYHIRGTTVDENMGAFFRSLGENTLETFTVLGSNEIGFQTLEGLMQHASSLKNLGLLSLQTTSLASLHLLSACPYLESLQIEASTPSPPSAWSEDDKDPLFEVVTWLKGNKNLRKLNIRNLGGAAKLLAESLKSTELRLKDLEVKFIDDDEGFYTALESQSELESLAVRSTAEIVDATGVRHDTFITSICACKKLKELNIMQHENLQLTPGDLVQMKDGIPGLEKLEFDGELLTDEIWLPLSAMRALTTITINGMSIFTFERIRDFMKSVASDGPRPGFRLEIMNQHSDTRIAPAQEIKLSKLAAALFGGTFEFQYWRNPSEDEMSDLSD